MDLATVATIFLLTFFQGGRAVPGVLPVGGSAPPRAAPTCAREGELVCNGCSTLGVCVEDGRWVAVQHCSAEGLVCWQGACVEASAPGAAACAGAAAAGCFAEGAFPQLDDCSRFVECAGAGAGAARSCPAGARFDACTGRCNVLASASGGGCAWQLAPGAACSRPGQYGVAPENDRLYYTCVATEDGIELRWSRCELGHFDTDLLRCVDLDKPGCHRNDEDGTVTTPTPTPPTTSESSTPPTVDPNQCKAGSAYPNPSTNCNYFFCQPDGEYLQIFCNGGFHFDITEGMCVSGQCENFADMKSKSEDE